MEGEFRSPVRKSFGFVGSGKFASLEVRFAGSSLLMADRTGGVEW